MSGFGNDDFETQFYKLEQSGLKNTQLVKQQVRPLNKPLLPVVTQVNTPVQQEQFASSGYSQPQSQYAPPVYPPQAQYTSQGFAPTTTRLQPQTSMAQLNTGYNTAGVDVTSNAFQMALNEFKIEGWESLSDEQKQAYVEDQKLKYNVELTTASNGVSLEEKIDKRTKMDQSRLEDYLNITMRSEQIASIKKGFAIPSYASNIEIVQFPISVLLPPVANFGATKNVIPVDLDRRRLFGSIDNYGQGDYVQPLRDSSGFHYLGNLQNTFICKIEISDIISKFNIPIGVRVGETERDFSPYQESMKFVGRKGERYHYIIPPQAKITGPIVIYVNSKDADHEYGYFYTHLTADAQKIMLDDNIGESRDPHPSYQYKLDHPIARHLACYSSRDGIQFPEIKRDRTFPYIDVRKTLASEIARQIADLSRSKIPTRNLERFDFRLEALPGFQEQFDAWEKCDHESANTKLLNQMITNMQVKTVDPKTPDTRTYQPSITQISNTPLPVYFNVSMTYIFRDDAARVYESAIKQG